MRKIGNLFELAEKRLIREKRPYTLLDIIDYAIKIRKWLDVNENKIKKLTKLTKEAKRKRNNEARYRYYLKVGK